MQRGLTGYYVALKYDFGKTRQTLRGRQDVLELLFGLYFQQELWLALSLTAVQAVNFVPVSFTTFSAVISHHMTLVGAIKTL